MSEGKTFMDFLKPKDRDVLCADSDVVTYKSNDLILKEGDINTTIYTILEGEVSITSTIGDHELELHRLGPGEVIGEMSFIDNDPVSADVVACGEVSLKAIDTEILAQYILKDPFFFGRFYKALARTLSSRLRTEGTASKERMARWNFSDVDN